MDSLQLILARLRKWSNQSANRGIFFAAAIVASMTVLVKAISLMKDLLVANNFGVSKELDAYLISFILPSFVINVVAGAFYSSLVPTYIEVRARDGEQAAQDLFSAITTRALIILFACAALLALIGPPILPVLGYGFDAQTLAMCRSMFFITLPSIVVNGMVVIWGAILNSGNKFALSAITPIAVPAATIVFISLFFHRLGIYTLALGLMIGFLIQAIFLGWSLRTHGLSLWPKLRSANPLPVNQVMSQFMPAVAGAIFMSSTDLIDQAMATPLGSGSVSALNFGVKLTAIVIGIGSLALGTAVLPYFSRQVAERDWKSLRHTYSTYMRLIVIITGAFVLFAIVFSETLVRLFFQRGAFTAADTQIVSQIQIFYVLQVPFYFLSILTVRLISSLKANRVMFWGTIINFSVNISLNYICINLFGVAGIALSTSAVYVASFFFLRYMLDRELRKVESVLSL